MPIPKPRKGEPRDKYIPRCISALAKVDPDTPPKQRIAICFSTWRKSKGIKKKEEIQAEEEGEKLYTAIYELVGEK